MPSTISPTRTKERATVGIFSNSPTLKAPAQSSAPQNTSVGSGSRPTPSRFKIKTSAPDEPRMLDRMVPGALGVGGRGKDQGER
jgi:hypothetical protein